MGAETMPEKTIHIKTEDADYVILLEQSNRMAEAERISREYILELDELNQMRMAVEATDEEFVEYKTST